MKRAIRFLARLYPAVWRRRYGAEFDALIEDNPPTPRSAMDVLFGALRMQFSSTEFWMITGVALACGGTVATVLFWKAPRGYPSVAIFRARDVASQAGADQAQVAFQCALSRSTLTHILEKTHAYAEPISEKTISRLRNAVRIDRLKGKILQLGDFSVRFNHPDKDMSQRVLMELTTHICKCAPDKSLVPKVTTSSTRPEKPKLGSIAAWSCVAAIFGGFSMTLLRRRAAV